MKNLIMSLIIVPAIVGNAIALDCQRTVKAISATEVKVEITIKKDNLAGFARLAEYIPDGSVVKYAKSEGGTFTIQDNKVKFIWLALPQSKVVSATYTVNTEYLKEGDYPISGKFSYVENDQTKEYEIPSSNFTINNNQVASIATVPATADYSLTTTTASEKNPTATKSVATEKTDKTTAKASKVIYALQLLSTKDKLPTDYFSKKYEVKEPVKVEMVNGLNKYIMGEFKSTEEAITFRETLAKKGCKDAFIIAYLNNQRITMDEAKKLESK